jgi:hypothetical protein
MLRQPNAKAKGRHFKRIGQAALKQGKLVYLKDISDYAQLGKDLRQVPFYSITEISTTRNYAYRDYSTHIQNRQRARGAAGLPWEFYGVIR